jgi:hypothetical protein
MYILKFEESELKKFEITSGDAPMGCAMAVLKTSQETVLLEKHIEKYGRVTQEGIYELTFQPKHTVIDEDGEKLNYSGGLLFWAKELEEITIDIVGIPYPEYQNRFPELVRDYHEQHKST